MEIAQLAIFGLLLNVIISIASPWLTGKFGEEQAKNIKIAIMYIVPIGLAILKVFYGDSFWETLLIVGGTASYIYGQISKPTGDPVANITTNVVDTFRK